MGVVGVPGGGDGLAQETAADQDEKSSTGLSRSNRVEWACSRVMRLGGEAKHSNRWIISGNVSC